MDNLPDLLEAEQSLSDSELLVLKKQFLHELDCNNLRPQTKFNYAWALVRSQKKADQTKGVELLNEIYKEIPSRRRECLYYLALGEFKLGHYREARRLNDILLQKEPNNSQGIALQRMIDDKVKSEGVIGMAIMGGVVATVGILVGILAKRH